eukprot:8340704-Pyramimonas_sp.AAC.1
MVRALHEVWGEVGEDSDLLRQLEQQDDGQATIMPTTFDCSGEGGEDQEAGTGLPRPHGPQDAKGLRPADQQVDLRVHGEGLRPDAGDHRGGLREYQGRHHAQLQQRRGHVAGGSFLWPTWRSAQRG